MVAGHVEERHLQFFDVTVELLPLRFELFVRLLAAFDQIADRQHELRLQQVEPSDGLREHLGPMAARSVADDGKLELGRVVVRLERRPRVALLLVDGERGSLLGTRKGHGGGEQSQRPQAADEMLHWSDTSARVISSVRWSARSCRA